MRTAIFLAAMLLASTAYAADRKMPPKFVGEWCGLNGSTTHTRGRCRDPSSDARLTVSVNGYRWHETDCKVVSVADLPKKGSYQIKARCRGEGETWSENNTISLDNKGRLIFGGTRGS